MKKIPYWLSVLLIPLFFMIHGWQQYYYYLNADVVMHVFGVYMVLAGIIGVSFLILLRERHRAVFATSLLLIVFFLWGWLHGNLLHLFGPVFWVKVSVLSVVLIILGVLGYRQFHKTPPNGQQRVLGFISLLFLVYVLVDVATIMVKEFGRHDTVKQYTKAALQTRTKPDMVLILFDEFPSTISLQENLHFDNRDIDTFLQQKGFSVQSHSHSNYNLTTFSMASMFNGGYNDFIVNRDSLDEHDFNKGLNTIENNDATERLIATGYRFVNLSIFDIAGQASPLTINLFPAKSRLLTANTYYDKVLEPFVNMLKKPDSSKLWGMNNYTDVLVYNKEVRASYLREIAVKSPKPRFIYLHLLLPHNPYYYDSLGNELSIDVARKVSREDNPEYYLNNLRVARKWLKELVDTTMAKTNGKAIIMVMGDHGYKKRVYNSTTADAFANLNAVYYPDKDYSLLKDSSTNINTMKSVMNKIFVQPSASLPDSMIFLKQRQYE